MMLTDKADKRGLTCGLKQCSDACSAIKSGMCLDTSSIIKAGTCSGLCSDVLVGMSSDIFTAVKSDMCCDIWSNFLLICVLSRVLPSN